MPLRQIITALSDQTGVFVIRGSKREGLVFIADGRVVHAETELARGPGAFFELANETGGHFYFNPGVRADTVSIMGSRDGLLMNSAFYADLVEILREKLVSLDTVLQREASRPPEEAVGGSLDSNALELLLRIEQKPVSIRELCNESADSGQSVLFAVETAVRLLDAKLIEPGSNLGAFQSRGGMSEVHLMEFRRRFTDMLDKHSDGTVEEDVHFEEVTHASNLTKRRASVPYSGVLWTLLLCGVIAGALFFASRINVDPEPIVPNRVEAPAASATPTPWPAPEAPRPAEWDQAPATTPTV